MLALDLQGTEQRKCIHKGKHHFLHLENYPTLPFRQ